MLVREALDGDVVDVGLLKCSAGDVMAVGMPPQLPKGGLSHERALYLYKDIRHFVPEEYRNELCPRPVAGIQAVE